MTDDGKVKITTYRSGGISNMQAAVTDGGRVAYVGDHRFEARIYGGWYVGFGDTAEEAIKQALGRMQKEMEHLQVRVRQDGLETK